MQPLAGEEAADAIYTHRTLFTAYPGGHAGCAAGLGALAACLEHREAEMDRRAGEAFRYEANLMEAWWRTE
jgi:hypothetical protein